MCTIACMCSIVRDSPMACDTCSARVRACAEEGKPAEEQRYELPRIVTYRLSIDGPGAHHRRRRLHRRWLHRQEAGRRCTTTELHRAETAAECGRGGPSVDAQALLGGHAVVMRPRSARCGQRPPSPAAEQASAAPVRRSTVLHGPAHDVHRPILGVFLASGSRTPRSATSTLFGGPGCLFFAQRPRPCCATVAPVITPTLHVYEKCSRANQCVSVTAANRC